MHVYVGVVVFKYLIYAGKYNFHFSKWVNSNQCFQFPSASNFCRESRGFRNISTSPTTGMAVLIYYIYLLYLLSIQSISIYLTIYLSILSTQGWVCAAIGCVQCTAVFLSSSSICLIAVDRWEHQGLLVLSHLRVYAKCAWNWDANTKVMRDKQLHRFLSWLWFLRWYPNFKPTYSV